MFHAVNRADHTQGFWNRPRQPDMAEMQYQVNNWYHFVWLSGDHIVEQHVHASTPATGLRGAHRCRPQGLAAGGPAEPGISEIFDHHCVQYT